MNHVGISDGMQALWGGILSPEELRQKEAQLHKEPALDSQSPETSLKVDFELVEEKADFFRSLRSLNPEGAIVDHLQRCETLYEQIKREFPTAPKEKRNRLMDQFGRAVGETIVLLPAFMEEAIRKENPSTFEELEPFHDCVEKLEVFYEQEEIGQVSWIVRKYEEEMIERTALSALIVSVETVPDKDEKKPVKQYAVVGKGEELGRGLEKFVERAVLQAQYATQKPEKVRALSRLVTYSDASVQSAMREGMVSRGLRRKGVPCVLKERLVLYKTAAGDQRYGMLSEYCNQGDLFGRLQAAHDPRENVELIRQLCTTLREMHRHNLCHLDVKMENVFITRRDDGRPEIRLGDLSFVERVGKNTGLRGTFLSPELREAVDVRGVPTQRSMDLWPLGDILLVWRHGRSYLQPARLFGDQLPIEEYKKKAREARDEVARMIGREADELDQAIIRLFSYNPEERPSAAELVELIARAYP